MTHQPRATVLIASLFLALPLTGRCLGKSEDATITVNGDAEVRVAPDEIVITAGVESRAATVAAASKDNDEKVRAVVDFLKKSGIEERNIRTEYLSIEPIYRDDNRYQQKGKAANVRAQANENADPFGPAERDDSPQPVGYQASRQFAITITDLKLFEIIYKGLIEQGINRVRGIEFRTSELRKLRDKARLGAVHAAREKAEAMSTELGATLKSVKTIVETPSGPYSGSMYQNSTSNDFDGASSSPTTFAAGQISITSSVQVVFILGDTELKK